MAARLLLFAFMCAFVKNNAQDLLQPKLMVEPLEITETDPVTISCQLPPSVSLSTCYFEFSRQKPAKTLSCLKTLTGKELLSMAGQSSPSEVEVRCFYLDANQSPMSNISTVIIHIPRPVLTGYPAVITEMDSVVLKCSTPSSFPVTGCFLKFMRTKVSQSISCEQDLGGVDLLFLAKQTSPAQVDLTCYYTVKHKGADQISPDSHILSIRIGNMYEWTTTPMTVPLSVTTGQTTWRHTVSSPSASVTPQKPTPEESSPASTSDWWKLMVLQVSCGLTLGIFLLGMTLFCSNRNGKYFHQRAQPNHTGDSVDMWNIGRLLPAGNDETFTEVIFEPVADPPAV